MQLGGRGIAHDSGGGYRKINDLIQHECARTCTVAHTLFTHTLFTEWTRELITCTGMYPCQCPHERRARRVLRLYVQVEAYNVYK